MFATVFVPFTHTHQLEFANTSFPTLVCRAKAALPCVEGAREGKGFGKAGARATRVAQGGLWHGSRTEKIEDHGSRI